MDFDVKKVDYSIPEFFETFGNNLPRIVIVTQGFHGEIVEDTFDRDQIYRLHTTSRQKRVIAKAANRHYSIPLNYPLKVCVVKKHGKLGKEKTLKDITASHAFPVDVKFAKNQEFAVGSLTTSANRFPQLKLIDVFDEIYLLGNAIIDGVIALSIVKIPLYLSLLRVSEICGIKTQTQDKWKRYTEELNELVTGSVEFDLSYGNKDIAVYQEDFFKADTVYTYVEPRTYTDLSFVGCTHGIYTGLSKDSSKDLRPQSQVYEELPQSEKPDNVRSSEEVSGELKRFFDKKIISDRPLPRVPNNDSSDKNNKESESPVLPKRHPNTKFNTASNYPQKPKVYVNDKPKGMVLPTKQYDKQGSREPLMPTTLHDKMKIFEPTVPSVQKEQDKLVRSELAAKQPYRSDSSALITRTLTDNGDGKYVATKSFHIEGLSMKELADCLKTLKLEKYVTVFQENMIDGTILKELNVEILKTDFGFNTVEAIRLMKFANDGYIPK